MDTNSEQLEFKGLVVKLKETQDILRAEVNHLRGEINKRVSDIQLLLAQRELALNREPLDTIDPNFPTDHQLNQNSQPNQAVNISKTEDFDYSSEFARQVGILTNNLMRTSEEVSTLIKL